MKKTNVSPVVALVTLFFVFQSPAIFAELRKWNQKMQEMGKTFSELLPELSDSRPITPATRKTLEKGAKQLLKLSHTINLDPSTIPNPLPPEADPTIGFISKVFNREVKHAYEALQNGHVAYARAALRSVSGLCIACHSRHDMGPDFPGYVLNTKSSVLTRMQKAELLAATRQFDAALGEFEKIAKDATAAEQKRGEWARAVRHGMTIAIRVKNDPDRALALINPLMKLPKLPGFYASQLPAWKKSIEQWKAEPIRKETTEEGLFLQAKQLSEAGRNMQKWAFDHSADVLYLRSSAIAHELLTVFPHGKRSAEALLLAGTAYDTLGDRLTSPLSEMYYEACVRQAPHSPVAEECFQRYETNILFGYSGSAGVFVPDDVQDVLSELRALAAVVKAN